MENVETTNNSREQALLDFLGLGEPGPDDLALEALSYLENGFTVDGGDYLVLTDSEADEAAKDYIKESLWAFNADFLANYTGLPKAVFEALQPQCESANDALLQIIGDDFDHFAEQAMSADGRGHFIATYDGDEGETGEYFIYRIN